MYNYVLRGKNGGIVIYMSYIYIQSTSKLSNSYILGTILIASYLGEGVRFDYLIYSPHT